MQHTLQMDITRTDSMQSYSIHALTLIPSSYCKTVCFGLDHGKAFHDICKKDIATIASKDGRDLQEWLPLSRNHRNDRAIIHNQGRRGGSNGKGQFTQPSHHPSADFFSVTLATQTTKKTSGGEAVKDGSRLRRRRRGGGGNGGNESGTAKEEDGGKKKSRGSGADLDSTAREREEENCPSMLLHVCCL